MPLASRWTALAVAFATLLAAPLAAQAPTLDGTAAASRAAVSVAATPSADAVTLPAWTARLDATARALALSGGPPSWGAAAEARFEGATVDLFVQTDAPAALAARPGVEVRAQAGDVAVVRVPVAEVAALAQDASVRFVEAPQVRERLNDTGRADLRADVVQSGGGGLPQAFNGEGVVVGVLDSGLDVTHPDFFGASGSRVQYLLEFLQGGGEAVYTKAQIDANPAAIPQRDGNGGGGHGTHVTGTAAGSGGASFAHRGVAPASDLVFVKGVRHPDSQGGFSDADVVAGADFVFQRAAELGRPAVLNLSLGGHIGSPHDGTSLYEQALENLAGPGRIIVAAAGNDGFSAVHAGAQVSGAVENETLVLPSSPDLAVAEMWYDGGAQNAFAIGAYTVSGGQLLFLGLQAVNAGQVLGNGGNTIPFVVQGSHIGNIYIDASTVQDPRNGDGSVLFVIEGGGGIDIRNIVWSIISTGGTGGRIDSWASGAEFYAAVAGIPGVQEVPGDYLMSVGTPSTSRGVLAVGSHVTNNTWTDVDGVPRQWQNPHPTDPGGSPVVPQLGQLSYFSSRGPTRDGRLSPDVTGPGELIFSSLSSHLTVGQGVQRELILQGGAHQGQQGTSMASPHLAGTVALMLQADAGLTPDEARSILQETARADGFTGQLPNAYFGAGKADALAAVQRTLDLCGSDCGGTGSGTTAAEAEPNDSPDQAQRLFGPGPITVSGQADHADLGALAVQYTGAQDDIEDLFRVTTTSAGLTLSLGGFSQDLDLVLLTAAGEILDLSNTVNPSESISAPSLPPGEYLVGVSFYDAGGETGSSGYSLVVTGAVAVDSESGPESALVLHPAAPNPVRGETTVAFDLPAPADAELAVFDVLGREVARLAEGAHAAGAHRASLDARGLSAGVYVVRLRTAGAVRTQTVVVAR